MAVNPYATFERDLKLITAGFEPEAIQRQLAAFARKSVAEVIANGEAPSTYDKFVNGRQGAPEESVELPGPIVYVFTNWPLVIQAALAELERRSPKKSGRFAASFIVIVNGRIVTDFSTIKPADEVIITNAQPYLRKVEAGLMSSKRFYVFDGTKNAMVRRFGGKEGAFSFVTRWLNIGSGVHPLIPYILKGDGPLVEAKRNRKSSAFREGRTHLARRKDRAAGTPLTYPAIIVNQN